MADESVLAVPFLTTYTDARLWDAQYGSRYFTTRWHRHAVAALGGGVSGLLDEYFRQLAQRAYQEDSAGDPAGAIQRLAAGRVEVLKLHQTWVQTLRSLGCASAADLAVVSATASLAAGPEFEAAVAKGQDYWDSFRVGHLLRAGTGQGAKAPVWLGSVDDKHRGALANAVAPTTVAKTLGPLPDRPAASRKPAASDGDESLGLPPAAESDDVARAPRSPRVSPGQGGGAPADGTGTWLTAAGLGQRTQPDLDGFWRTEGSRETFLTRIELSSDGKSFTGRSIIDGKLRGPWLEFRQDGGPTTWTGRVLIALLEPKGACPKWRPGRFLIRPGEPRQQGIWRGKKVNPATCEDTPDPDEGVVPLERQVLASFQAIVPGKFIHILGAPAAGPQAAQYSAAVELSCRLDGLPVADVKVSTSSGRLVQLGKPCRYQLVVPKAGTYELRVDYLDAAGTVMHRDYLRAEVPPIPGLGG
jgi:hypothetical protein